MFLSSLRYPFHALLLGCALLAGCQSNQPRPGGGTPVVSGDNGPAGTHAGGAELLRCDRPIGVAALVDPGPGRGMRSTIEVPGWIPHYVTINPGGLDYTGLGQTNPVAVVKLIMSHSGCFRIVDRGAASLALQRERAIAASGQLQPGQGVGPGQMLGADYIVIPTITRNNPGASGGLSALGGLLPGIGGVVASGLKVTSKEAEVMLTVTSVRSGEQVAIAQGSATKTDIGFGGLGYLGLAGMGSYYQNTDMGKMVAAAFVDAHNKLVRQLRAMPAVAASDHAGATRPARLRAASSAEVAMLTSLPVGDGSR